MLWVLIMLVVGITFGILYENLWFHEFVYVISIALIVLSFLCLATSPFVISCVGHTETVSVRYTDGTIVRDDDSPIYLIHVDRKSYWNWIDDVTTYKLKRQDQELVSETKDKSKILAWFEGPVDFKF